MCPSSLLLPSSSQPLSELAGTLDYMAPELLARCYSASADVWSAGIMLHELLTGRLPYAGDTPDEVRAMHSALLLLLLWPSLLCALCGFVLS